MSQKKFQIDEIMLVLAVGILAIIVSVYSKLNEPVTMEAEKITEIILDDHAMSLANNGVVDENKLREIEGMDYENFKKSLNAKNDFCVYIEDGNGEIILSKGSGRLNGDGLHCRE